MLPRLALLLALVALPAGAASQLDAVRGAATKAREQANAVRATQSTRRSELNQLSARIEALKASSSGKLLPGTELDGALKRSQELSDELTGLAQALSRQEGELESANLVLLTELSGELARLRADFDRQPDRGTRIIIIKRLREARAEREQVRAMLPATKVPALLAVKPSDDPEDLLEQADLMRDREDQVRRDLKSLEVRIAERREERELDRRVNQFLGDDSMFDDSDRRLRIRVQTEQQPVGPAKSTGFADTGGRSPGTKSQVGAPYESANDLFGAAQTTTMGAGAPARETGGVDTTPPPAANDPTAPPAGGSGENAAPTVKVTSGSDARPAVGTKTRIAGGEDEDLEDLEIQRAKLKGLAEELKARAKSLEKKAAQLR